MSEINEKDSRNVIRYSYLIRSNPKFRNNSSCFRNLEIYQKFINVEIDVVIIYSSSTTNRDSKIYRKTSFGYRKFLVKVKL